MGRPQNAGISKWKKKQGKSRGRNALYFVLARSSILSTQPYGCHAANGMLCHKKYAGALCWARCTRQGVVGQRDSVRVQPPSTKYGRVRPRQLALFACLSPQQALARLLHRPPYYQQGGKRGGVQAPCHLSPHLPGRPECCALRL